MRRWVGEPLNMDKVIAVKLKRITSMRTTLWQTTRSHRMLQARAYRCRPVRDNDPPEAGQATRRDQTARAGGELPPTSDRCVPSRKCVTSAGCALMFGALFLRIIRFSLILSPCLPLFRAYADETIFSPC